MASFAIKSLGKRSIRTLLSKPSTLRSQLKISLTGGNGRMFSSSSRSCEDGAIKKGDHLNFSGPHPEKDDAWRHKWIGDMTTAIWDHTRESEEKFVQKKTEWLDGRFKRRERKFNKLKKSLLGNQRWDELTDRQQKEWSRLTKALVGLELDPAVATLEDLGDDMWTDEKESVLPPEGFEFSSSKDLSSPYTTQMSINISDRTAEEAKNTVFDELTHANVQAALPHLTNKFTAWQEPPSTHFLRFESQQRFELNPTQRTERREAKIVLKVTVADLRLSDLEKSYFLELATTNRYSENKDELRLVGNRFPTSEMNREYLRQLLTHLVVESKKLAATEESATAVHLLQKM